MKLNRLISVSDTADPHIRMARILMTLDGVQEEVNYAVDPNDNHGLAPEVRAEVQKHIDFGRPVNPYVPPTAAELRASMPKISPRQLFLTLNSIGITEADLVAALAGNPDGLIELKWAPSFSRTHPLITSMGTVFSLPPEQIDSLWLYAKDL